MRWVASSVCTVRHVWLSYEALHLHFTRKTSDPLTESRENAKFSGLAIKLETDTLMKNLGLMHGAQEDLSLALHQWQTSLSVDKLRCSLPERHLIPFIIKRHLMQLKVVYLEVCKYLR